MTEKKLQLCGNDDNATTHHLYFVLLEVLLLTFCYLVDLPQHELLSRVQKLNTLHCSIVIKIFSCSTNFSIIIIYKSNENVMSLHIHFLLNASECDR